MRYYEFVHNLGIHSWDIPALIVAVILVVMILVHHRNQKKRLNDFEDDLMLGVANRIDVDYVVTEDKNLIKHTNGVCINVDQALRLVEGSSVPSARPV